MPCLFPPLGKIIVIHTIATIVRAVARPYYCACLCQFPA
jgi:hypothetical protein